MMRPNATVFVVDDDEAVRDALHKLLSSSGFETRSFASAGDLLEVCAEERADCALVDVHMPGMSGFELMEQMAARDIDLPVIVITGQGDAWMEQRALAAGAVGLLHKPFEKNALLRMINLALARNP